MNVTRNQRTNQRIERMSAQHVIVGIDIAKDTHAAHMTDFRGRVLTHRHLSFSNTEEGFEKLLRQIGQVQDKHRLSSVIIGMEPTGHYWFNLASWLLEHHIEVVLVNPVTTHRNKENRDNSPSKNDPKDALTIADVVSRGFYTDYAPQAPVFERIKTVMSHREFWVKSSISLSQRVMRWIDLYFPELHAVFPDWTVPRARASLRAFPWPSELESLTADDVIEGWRKQGMERAGGVRGKAKAEQLLRAATRSIGRTVAQEEARRDLQRLLDAYEHMDQQLRDMEREVEELLDELPMAEQLRSIGIGTVTIAALLGYAGDLRRYAHGCQLLRRAGLNLAECMSGKHKGRIRLSKRGDSALRKHLYLGVCALVGRHPDFKRWHADNQARGMTKMKSIFKLIGKLARIVIGMIQRGEPYRWDIHAA